jgi:hypothetical protein
MWPDPGDRSAAGALRHRARVHGRRPRHDQLVRELVLDDPEPFVPLVMQLLPQPRHRPIEMMQIVLRYDRCPPMPATKMFIVDHKTSLLCKRLPVAVRQR